MSLSQKKCVHCERGTQPLSGREIDDRLQECSGWELSKDGRAIVRKIKFGDFKEALSFVNRVGEVAEQENHHPDICFGWGYCEIELQTHAIGGLHENDFVMAAKINDIVREPAHA
ncbi:MAG TPA: 4a-hydroxytetrahydrobiopterin dehydratase [Planctomycetota bacterium]|jgi:4a-hydroxytetrahydrobiopterin dehydratase